MLQRRLIPLAIATAAVVAACSGEDGAIREAVVDPGLEAIDESRSLACGAEAATFTTALELYEVLEGEPAPDTESLIDAGLLRESSELWRVADGQLIALDPACGDVDATIPTAQIITETDNVVDPAALSVDELVATYSAEETAALGGPECVRELVVIQIGAQRYTNATGEEPEALEQVADGGYLDEPVELWIVIDDVLRPTDGSPCTDLAAAGSDG